MAATQASVKAIHVGVHSQGDQKNALILTGPCTVGTDVKLAVTALVDYVAGFLTIGRESGPCACFQNAPT